MKRAFFTIIILLVILQINFTFSTILNQSYINNTQDFQNNQSQIQTFSKNTLKDLQDDDAIMGNPNAPVTLVEFGGLQEPFSRYFWINIFPEIKSKYIESGKVKYVFRDFPLDDYFLYDGYAAVVGQCVHILGGDNAYFLFLNNIYNYSEELDEEIINQIALNTGYNVSECLKDDNALDEVVLDLTDALYLGLEGSPSFYINNEFISGAQDFSKFQDIIEIELNKSIICFSNSQCNDSNIYTFDRCINPGQFNSYCKHEQIKCLKNSDCGVNSIIKYCSSNSLCQNSTAYTCINPSTPQSSCKITKNDSCTYCQFGCNSQNLICKSLPLINIYSPQSIIYNDSTIRFNISASNYSFSKIAYFDLAIDNSKEVNLCNNCNEIGIYKKISKNFNEGEHNLSFMFINNTVYFTKNITFFIDSTNPKVISTLPKINSFSNGSNFFIKYSEENCKYLSLIINSDKLNKSFIYNCSSGKNIQKTININLSSFNNEMIQYHFILADKAENIDLSKKIKVKVDTIKPEIKSFSYKINGKKVTFILNISEQNFQEINYIDYNDKRLIIRTICSSLKNNICTSTKNFNNGLHNVSIFVFDKAGNNIQKNFKLIIN